MAEHATVEKEGKSNGIENAKKADISVESKKLKSQKQRATSTNGSIENVSDDELMEDEETESFFASIDWADLKVCFWLFFERITFLNNNEFPSYLFTF